MKRGWLVGICTLCAIPLLLSGCTGKQTQKDQLELARAKGQVYSQQVYDWGSSPGHTLSIWALAGELDRVYMQRALERYATITQNRISIVEFSGDDFNAAVEKALSSPSAEQPDLVLSYGGTNVERFHPDENFYDFTQAQWVNDLTMTAIDQSIYNGKVIGLPHWEASISGMLYNKELFKKYKLEIPQTQSEFMAACQVLLENGITPLYLPYAEITMLLYQFPLDTLLENPQTIANLNSGTLGYADMPGMEQIVQWYRDMAEAGYLGANYLDNNWDGMSPAMESGKYAMMPCWDTWLYTDFQGDPTKFGLMPAFMGVPGSGTFQGPNLELMMVNRNGTQVEEAVAFVLFMADPYNYNYAFEGIYTAPVFKQQVGSISTPQYVEAERMIEKHFRSSTAWLRIRGFSQMDAVYIQKYMTGTPDYTVADCLKDMDAARRKRSFG